MIKRLLTSALMMLAVAASTFAAHVLTVNGQQVQKTVVKLTFEGDNVVLHFDDNSDPMTTDMSGVSFTFGNASGIEAVSTFTYAGVVNGVLTLTGIANGTQVAVYAVNGSTVAAAVAADGSVSIDLSAVPAGVYVVRAGNDCVKFVKR